MGREIFDAIQRRVEEEPFAKKMGMKLIDVDFGYALVEMTFTEDMENICGMTHGGATFSLMDEAFEEIEGLRADALRLKDQALAWVYLVEWLVVSGVFLLCGFVLWTVMIRRRLYREVSTTRLAA